MAQKTVLGKGLASLFPGIAGGPPPGPPVFTPSNQPVSNTSQQSSILSPPLPEASGRDVYMGISMVPIEEIQTNQYQPRKDFDEKALQELAQSIKISGIIQPLLVRKNASKEGFELIAGERRLRAAKVAGLKQVPIVIRKSTDRETLELALVENIQRQDLNCVDEALAYYQLIEDFTLTQEEVADRVGKDRATVANYLRLLRLPQAIVDDLRKQLLTFGHGKALLSLDDLEDRMMARAQILEKKLSVRETEALVESMKASKAGNDSEPQKNPEKDPVLTRIANLSQDLTRSWSTKVEIKGSENKGKIIFHYGSREELDRLIEEMYTESAL